MAGTCPTCGDELSDHDRNLRFYLPEPALAVPESERAARFWGDDILLAVEDVGSFVRALLPIHLDDGGSLTFGLWLGVHPDVLARLSEVWWEPEYANTSFEGLLANDLAPWSGEMIGRPVLATVRDPDAVPYVVHSEDPLVRRIVLDRWRTDTVLLPYSHLL